MVILRTTLLSIPQEMLFWSKRVRETTFGDRVRAGKSPSACSNYLARSEFAQICIDGFKGETNMNRLLGIGFAQAGNWSLKNGVLSLSISRFGEQKNVLYSFLEDGEIRYVGKSTQSLRRRMYGYLRPSISQGTNVRVNGLIQHSLSSSHDVEILVLPDNGLMHYGQFHLNLAAGLEDSIIASIRPPWNGGQVKVDSEPTIDPIPVIDRFPFQLHPTYFEHGYFNVPSANAASFGDDGQTIDVFISESEPPIRALINRRSNQNGTPRIMGGADLRTWLQSQSKIGDLFVIEVYSSRAIRLRRT